MKIPGIPSVSAASFITVSSLCGCACGRLVPVSMAHRRCGLSLIEIVIALGVLTFALVGIIGLFPVAIRANLESQWETRAVHMARLVLADLRVNSSSNRLYLAAPPGLMKEVNVAEDGASVFLAFSGRGEPHTNAVTHSEFEEGVAEAAYLVGLRVDTNTGCTGLSHIEASIEAPASAPAANRSKFRFVTLLSYQEEF